MSNFEVFNEKFQQNGATAHKAKLIPHWFIENRVTTIPLCARSPDLIPS